MVIYHLNNLLLRELMKKTDSWEIVSHPDGKESLNKLTSLRIPSFRILDAIQI